MSKLIATIVGAAIGVFLCFFAVLCFWINQPEERDPNDSILKIVLRARDIWEVTAKDTKNDESEKPTLGETIELTSTNMQKSKTCSEAGFVYPREADL